MNLTGVNRLSVVGAILGVGLAVLVLPAERAAAQDSRLVLEAEREKAMEASKAAEPDTLLHFSFPPIEIEGEYQLDNPREEKKYHQLYEDLKRTYPLSKIVSSEVKLVNSELDSIYTTKAKGKAYLKWYEKHIYHTYIDTLKSLNVRQIKLFIKLIDRETGSSPYDLIKKYRGKVDAMFWQLTANAMMVNLKKEYDPVEDAMIEDIIRKFY